MRSMNRRSAASVSALAGVLLSLSGCICLPGHVCVPDGGGDPDGPGGIRNPVVEVHKNDTRIGYMTTDPNNMNWEWWLVEESTTFPITLTSTDFLCFVPTEPGIMLTKAQFCEQFTPRFTNPKLYKMVTFVNTSETCPQ